MRILPHSSVRLILLLGLAGSVSSLSFLFLHTAGLVNLLIDAQSHLLQSIQVVHSLTPGVSQFGFWPPLLRILLLPTVLVLPERLTLEAGAFLTLLPLQLLGAYFLFSILRMRGVSVPLSFLGPVLFIMHPFIQYFTTSALTEMPFLVSLLGTTHFALRWIERDDLLSLFACAVFVSLATIARYEGFALIPLSILFVWHHCRSTHVPPQKLQALVILFSFIALLGLFFIFTYSNFYAGNPFAFLSLGLEHIGEPVVGFSRRALSMHALAESLQVFLRASTALHGIWLVASFPVCVFLTLLLRWERRDAMVLAFLFSPACFVLLMLLIGRNSISVPELPRFGTGDGVPYGLYANTRYALTWVAAAYVSLILALEGIARLGSFFRAVCHIVLVPLVLFLSVAWCVHVYVGSAFAVIRLDESISVPSDVGLIHAYDGGRVLFARYYSEDLILHSQIPLRLFVSESNYRYFDQAMREPWLFVRWVVVRHNVPRGLLLFENIFAMERTAAFQHFYELVDATDKTRTYRLREAVLRNDARALRYDPLKIPSLNPDRSWNPVTIYEELRMRD